MTRWSYKFELDSSKDDHLPIIEKVDDLKSINKFAPSVRDGLEIMYDIQVHDDIRHILSNKFRNQYGTKQSVKDLVKALNLLRAIELNDIETIFNLYPGLIQPMVKYSMQFTGMQNFIGYVPQPRIEPSIQDVPQPKEVPFNKEQAIQSLLS
jgi:hypothetical protein